MSCAFNFNSVSDPLVRANIAFEPFVSTAKSPNVPVPLALISPSTYNATVGSCVLIPKNVPVVPVPDVPAINDFPLADI